MKNLQVAQVGMISNPPSRTESRSPYLLRHHTQQPQQRRPRRHNLLRRHNRHQMCQSRRHHRQSHHYQPEPMRLAQCRRRRRLSRHYQQTCYPGFLRHHRRQVRRCRRKDKCLSHYQQPRLRHPRLSGSESHQEDFLRRPHFLLGTGWTKKPRRRDHLHCYQCRRSRLCLQMPQSQRKTRPHLRGRQWERSFRRILAIIRRHPRRKPRMMHRLRLPSRRRRRRRMMYCY